MTTPYRLVLILVTGIGAVYSLARAERGYQILFRTGWVGPEPIPSSADFFVYGILSGILTLFFLVLGFTIVYRSYTRKR
ncbi:MAG: hypothetical protein RL693_614 [Verrucomicrobiota bacterium]|jgi:hypothetical protein